MDLSRGFWVVHCLDVMIGLNDMRILLRYIGVVMGCIILIYAQADCLYCVYNSMV